MTRYHRTETYDQLGNVVDLVEIPYTPTEEAQADQDLAMNEIHDAAINALRAWSTLTLAQKDAVLRGLVRWALYKDNLLPLDL